MQDENEVDATTNAECDALIVTYSGPIEWSGPTTARKCRWRKAEESKKYRR